MTLAPQTDVEALLSRESRAALPLARQLLLYLDPFSLFKDASRGPARERERALSYNRAIRWMLLPYIRRWILIALGFFLAVAPVETLAAQKGFLVVPAAALAVAACIAVTIALCTTVAYLRLGARSR